MSASATHGGYNKRQTDIEISGSLMGAQVLAALYLLGRSAVPQHARCLCTSVRISADHCQPCVQSLSLLINTLSNFLHCTELPVNLWVRSHYRLRSIALFTLCLNPHFIG